MKKKTKSLLQKFDKMDKRINAFSFKKRKVLDMNGFVIARALSTDQARDFHYWLNANQYLMSDLIERLRAEVAHLERKNEKLEKELARV